MPRLVICSRARSCRKPCGEAEIRSGKKHTGMYIVGYRAMNVHKRPHRPDYHSMFGGGPVITCDSERGKCRETGWNVRCVAYRAAREVQP